MSAPALEAAFSVSVGRGPQAFSLKVELELEAGVLVLFGPSGSGKSLTVASIAGLVRPSTGSVRVGGRLLSDASSNAFVPTHQRRIGYVPQHHSLFPFRTVAENVAFGLPRSERRPDAPKVLALLEDLGLSHLASASPETLSGGERQRVALARAMAVEPDLLLLDEPLASLDASGRLELRQRLSEFLKRSGTPAVYVTHSVPEALELGDRVVRFSRGRTEESGAPAQVLASQSLRVEGTVTSVERAGPSTHLRLTEATVVGPTDSLVRSEDGALRLHLKIDE